MRTNALIYVMLAVALIVSSCGGIYNRKSTGQSSLSEENKNYLAVFDAWTRESRIYDGLETKLISKATFKSTAFRQAYAVEYARIYRVKGSAYDQLVSDQEKAASDYHDVIIAAYVPQKSWDDFSKKKSMWKIYLTTDGVEQILPLEIRKLKKKDPIMAYFFPYTTTWNSIYQARFPTIDPKTGNQLLGDPSTGLTMVMTSVLGSAEFQWDPQTKP